VNHIPDVDDSPPQKGKQEIITQSRYDNAIMVPEIQPLKTAIGTGSPEMRRGKNQKLAPLGGNNMERSPQNTQNNYQNQPASQGNTVKSKIQASVPSI